MGDRANVVIPDMRGGDNKVYLYTHWAGYHLPAILKRALERGRERWNDDQFLSRIIFCEMLKVQGKDALDGLTGAGISARLCDNGYNLLVVDCAKQEVYEAAEADPDIPVAGPWPMAEYPGEWAPDDDED